MSAAAPVPVATAGQDVSRWWCLAFGYGCFILACLPSSVTALDDDFGYLRSVVATLQHGRPWTDDWLEPWAASFSSLSALIYVVTHNFYWATYGLLAVLAGTTFGLAGSALQARGFRFGPAGFLAALGLTFPTLFWKTVQYTGMALYLPCLLGALCAAERRRWGCFFLAWGLALASRQSALAWVLLPLAVAAQTAWRERPWHFSRAVCEPLATAGAGLVLFASLRLLMNKTHAQLVLTEHVFEHVSLSAAWRMAGVGSLVFGTAAGLGQLLAAVPGFSGAPGFRRPMVAAGIALATVGLCLIDLRSEISWEHEALSGPVGGVYLKILVLLGGLGWMLRGGRLRPATCAGAFASLGLLSLRGMVWDYYLLDLAAFGLFGAAYAAPDDRENPAAARGWRWAAIVVGVLAVGVHGLLILDFKAYLDRSRAVNVTSEQALRAGRLSPAELSYAPFGFAAWHLYPHYVRHEGRASADLAGFRCYESPGAVEVGQAYSKTLHALHRFRHEPPSDRQNLIGFDETRYLWFFRAEYFLLRFKTAAEAPPDVRLPADFRAPLFPLSEAEWRELIDHPAASSD